jgi:hypothetical protein
MGGEKRKEGGDRYHQEEAGKAGVAGFGFFLPCEPGGDLI